MRMVLLQLSRLHIAAGKPFEAYKQCLEESSHERHFGFRSETQRVYMHPFNDQEFGISERIRQMIINIATALIDSKPLSKSMNVNGEGWTSISSSYDCLVMLGKDVPRELIDKLRTLIVASKGFARGNSDITKLENTFRKRFGS